MPLRKNPINLEINNKVKPPVKKDSAPRRAKATVRITLSLYEDIDTIEVGTFYKYKTMHVKGLGKIKSDINCTDEEFCISKKNECVHRSKKDGALWIISKYPETDLLIVETEKMSSKIDNNKVDNTKDKLEDIAPIATIEKKVNPFGEEGAQAGPGRPAGSRNKCSYLKTALGPMVCDSLVSTIKKLIKDGDKATILWAADKIYVAPKEEIFTFFDIGPIKTMGDINTAMERVIIGGTTAQLSHDEVHMIVDVLERKRKIIFETRLQVMLDAMKLKNENLNIAEVMKFYE